MMSTYIKKEAIKNLFSTNGFTLVKNDSGLAFRYKNKAGFSLEFPVKWLDGDDDREYDLAQVRHVLNNMTAAAKEEAAIDAFMRNEAKMAMLFSDAKDYGMAYDEDAKMFIYKKTKTSKKAEFVAELDFVIAARIKSEEAAKLAAKNKKKMKVLTFKEIFDILKKRAEEDKKPNPTQEKVNK